MAKGGNLNWIFHIHELIEFIPLEDMLSLHLERYPYSYTKEDLKRKLIDFDYADPDFNPICLKGKYWELIREDIEELVDKY